jgi:outer membrane protein assembly complex protein YaeT
VGAATALWLFPPMTRPVSLALALALLALFSPPARAVQLEALEPGREWRVAQLSFRGNHVVTDDDLRGAMVTKAPRWYEFWKFWRAPPSLDVVTLRADLDRVRQLYRNHGYYHARVAYDLELPAEGTALRVVLWIDEGPPVFVESVTVSLAGVALPPAEEARVRAHLPIAPNQVFTEDAYTRTYTYLRTYYREHGFARAEESRKAEVDLARDAAAVEYHLDSGPRCVFGEVHIEGAPTVGEDVVRREIAFREGEPFKQSLVERTRSNLVGLRLFRSIRIDEDESREPRVDFHIRVVEAPKHEVRLGVGYDTEEQIRGLAAWRDYDFMGGARQLGFSARASFIRRTIAADFLQPHFPGSADKVKFLAFEQEEEEDTYTNDRTRLSPRIEWEAVPGLTPYASYRAEYDSLTHSSMTPAVRRRFHGLLHGFLSGFAFGVDWVDVDDLLDPTRGWTANASVEPVGSLLGGDFSFLRFVAEGRRYQRLPSHFVLALRARLGTEDPIAGSKDVPLFERFYAGGINSVRGYDRRRVGPDASFIKDDPIGGRSIVESSVELQHPITEKIGWALFLDAGQISLDSYDFPIGDLQYGTGFGVRYKSPVGPLRLDIGFPVQPRPGDARWQVHVSVGQAF